LGLAPAAHHRLLIKELEDIEAGRNDRLLVSMPPGSAKSTYASKLFPAWFLARKPNRSVIGASHTSTLAEDFSRDVQSFIREHGQTLGYRLLTEPAELWKTSNGGRYRAAGVGGPITGSRADVAIIDDPVKSREQADSPAQRERVWKWFMADLRTRLRPGASIVVIMTRWSEDDLGGRILTLQPDRWRTLILPAFAVDNDPLGRKPGEPLWSDDTYGYGGELSATLHEYRQTGGMRDWYALYQQTPRPDEGSLFKTTQVAVLPTPPALHGAVVARAWDLAATKKLGTRDPDWTAGVKIARMRDGRLIVLDVVRLRGGPEEVERAIVNTATQDGSGVQIGLPQDPGQAGKSQILHLSRQLMGYRIKSSPETGSKETRAAPYAAQVNVGNVSVVHAPWNRPYLDELASFPGSKDDQVDASSRCFDLVAVPTYDASLSWVGDATY
jgi:predicted phage terminase large subunit-like protein